MQKWYIYFIGGGYTQISDSNLVSYITINKDKIMKIERTQYKYIVP